jgi:glycerol-3-phosphate cytidylyltransferase-like family protein
MVDGVIQDEKNGIVRGSTYVDGGFDLLHSGHYNAIR